jgi:alcohol dehydrogenase class IV
MLLRKLKHNAFISFAGFMLKFTGGAAYMLFAGQGSSRQLCQHIGHSGLKKVLVVTDKPLLELGIAGQAMAGLAEAGVETVIYDGVLPDPTYAIVEAGRAIYESKGCDGILAIGGGSSIDAAKVMGLALTHPGDPKDYVGFGKVKEALPPLYVIPTTSGTGSETTMGAVISDDETHEKGVISGGTMLPVACCLDPDLMTGMPPHITAATGMDALTHAVEGYIGVWDHGNSLDKAAAAVPMIFGNLEQACREGTDIAARNNMAHAAYMAGQAINQVNVGNVHAIAHQLGAFYKVPHGLANAMVMPHVLELSKEAASARLADLARSIGGETAEDFIAAVRELNAAVGIPAKLDELRPEDYDAIAERANAEADGYPVPLMFSPQDVITVLKELQA